MNLIQKYIPVNEYTRPGTKRSVTRNVVWHYTANNGASAMNHFTYFGETVPKRNRQVLIMLDSGQITKTQADKMLLYASANTFIDPKMTLEIIPNDEMAYHASQANPYSVGVELCLEADGSFHPDTIGQAVEYGGFLNKTYGIKTPDFLRHYDVTGKICPAPWVTTAGNPEGNKRWDAFKGRVDAAIRGKGDKTLNLTDDQWRMLAEALNELYHGSVNGTVEPWALSDYQWAEKAYARTLTVDELLWLNTIMFTRSKGIEI